MHLGRRLGSRVAAEGRGQCEQVPPAFLLPTFDFVTDTARRVPYNQRRIEHDGSQKHK